MPSDFLVPGLLALVAMGFTVTHEYQLYMGRPELPALKYGRTIVWMLAGASFGLAMVLPLCRAEGRL